MIPLEDTYPRRRQPYRLWSLGRQSSGLSSLGIRARRALRTGGLNFLLHRHRSIVAPHGWHIILQMWQYNTKWMHDLSTNLNISTMKMCEFRKRLKTCSSFCAPCTLLRDVFDESVTFLFMLIHTDLSCNSCLGTMKSRSLFMSTLSHRYFPNIKV